MISAAKLEVFRSVVTTEKLQGGAIVGGKPCHGAAYIRRLCGRRKHNVALLENQMAYDWM